MTELPKVVVVGATGAVGRCLVEILEQRAFPLATLRLVASARSAGERLRFRGQNLLVEDLDQFDFDGQDLAFFTAGGAVSRVHVPRAAAAGAVVIDNSSEFRYQPEIPLVVSEVNADLLPGDWTRGLIVANPNCSTMQLMCALAPLHRVYGLRRLTVATYQSVSGAGQKGLEELGRQSAAILNFQTHEPKSFPVQIAYNLIPHIDQFQANGYTREEMKMVWETRKILAAPEIEVAVTCVRVPVFYGHSEAVHCRFQRPIVIDEVRRVLATAPGVELVDGAGPGQYPTPVTHASGRDPVYVGRVRADLDSDHGLAMWIVADNVRKGAALNAVQIGEVLVKTLL